MRLVGHHLYVPHFYLTPSIWFRMRGDKVFAIKQRGFHSSPLDGSGTISLLSRVKPLFCLETLGDETQLYQHYTIIYKHLLLKVVAKTENTVPIFSHLIF